MQPSYGRNKSEKYQKNNLEYQMIKTQSNGRPQKDQSKRDFDRKQAMTVTYTQTLRAQVIELEFVQCENIM